MRVAVPACRWSPRIRLAVPCRSRSRSGNRGRARKREPDGRPLDAHVLDVGSALRDLQVDVEHVERRFPGAEFAAARERTALDALEQLLDVDAGDRALVAGRGWQCRSIARVRS